jgi:hypothetical protein
MQEITDNLTSSQVYFVILFIEFLDLEQGLLFRYLLRSCSKTKADV